MRILLLLIFCIFGNVLSYGQTINLSDPLTGWWKLDSILNSTNFGDTIVFHHDDNLIPFGTEFKKNGKYRTMTLWAFCGYVSRFERIFGGNKSKFRKGKWSLSVQDSQVFLLLEDSKIMKQKYRILNRTKDKIIAIRA